MRVLKPSLLTQVGGKSLKKGKLCYHLRQHPLFPLFSEEKKEYDRTPWILDLLIFGPLIFIYFFNPYLHFGGLLPTLSLHGDLLLLSPCSPPNVFASVAIHFWSLPVRCRTSVATLHAQGICNGIGENCCFWEKTYRCVPVTPIGMYFPKGITGQFICRVPAPSCGNSTHLICPDTT